MTETEIERLKAAFLRAQADPGAIRRCHRENLLRNLPRKARISLWFHHQSNAVLIWLCRTPKGSVVAKWLWPMFEITG